MVTRDTPWPEGTPAWVDVSVDDIGKARTFYSSLFGWDIPEGSPEFGGYCMAQLDGRQICGIGPKMGPAEMPSAWTTYLAVDDADATAKRITDNGGTVVAPVMDVMDAGRMAVALDAAGAAFGIWQSGLHTGFNLANELGAVTWNENMSRDFEANKAFYAAVFGHKFDDMSSDQFQYATINLGGPPVGGIGQMPADLPQQIPAHWMVYFSVPNADAAIEKIKSLGGGIQGEGAWDTPYGRMAMATDDQGAMFAIIQVPEGRQGEGSV